MPQVNLTLTPEEADNLHTLLEELLESGKRSDPLTRRTYRILGWRILATRDGTGITARVTALARKADSLEQYETARDQELGPILERLEGGENRDP